MWIVVEYMRDSEGLKDERKVISLTRYKDDALRIIKAARDNKRDVSYKRVDEDFRVVVRDIRW